mgnify:CR=1 FL=1|jgi:hypothetical protein
MRWYGYLGRVEVMEVTLWIWAITQLLAELVEIHAQWAHSLTAAISQYLHDVKNVVDLGMCTLIGVIAGLRIYCADSIERSGTPHYGEAKCNTFLLDLPKDLYALLIIAAFVRVLPFLMYYKNVGVLLLVLASMWQEIQTFFILLLVIAGGFSVAFAVLSGAEMNEPWYFLFGQVPLWQPFWV